MLGLRRFVSFALASVTVATLSGQTKPTFEVASVKRRIGPGPTSVTFIAQPPKTAVFSRVNSPVVSLVGWAFDVPGYQLIGGPDWARTDRFDVEGRAATEVSTDQMRLMVQSLLEDRFRLKTHRETRQMPIYTLLRARSDGRLGPNIVATDDCGKPSPLKEPPDTPSGAARGGGCVSMEFFAKSAAGILRAPVIDKTGLTGLWNFSLHYLSDPSRGPAGRPVVPSAPSDLNLPSYEQALQEQLGLKVEASRGPVEVLVIDSVEHPTEN